LVKITIQKTHHRERVCEDTQYARPREAIVIHSLTNGTIVSLLASPPAVTAAAAAAVAAAVMPDRDGLRETVDSNLE